MIISGWSKSIYYILFMVILTTTYGPNRSPRQQIQLEKSSKEATSGVGVLYWSAQRSRAWDLWRVFLLSHQSHLIDLLIFFQWKRRGSQLWGLVKCWFLPQIFKKKTVDQAAWYFIRVEGGATNPTLVSRTRNRFLCRCIRCFSQHTRTWCESSFRIVYFDELVPILISPTHRSNCANDPLSTIQALLLREGSLRAFSLQVLR